MPKKIKLTKEMFAIVDDCDYHWLSQIKWYAVKGKNKSRDCYYACADLFGGRKSKVKVLMHRFILLAPHTMTVDHKSHDTLDNRRENLRHATRAQQNANRLKSYGASKYKGVHRRWDGLKWVAQIKKSPLHIHLGSFETEEEAAAAYNKAAKKLFGKFACLNQLNQGE